MIQKILSKDIPLILLPSPTTGSSRENKGNDSMQEQGTPPWAHTAPAMGKSSPSAQTHHLQTPCSSSSAPNTKNWSLESIQLQSGAAWAQLPEQCRAGITVRMQRNTQGSSNTPSQCSRWGCLCFTFCFRNIFQDLDLQLKKLRE